jgi:hypothetical protein
MTATINVKYIGKGGEISFNQPPYLALKHDFTSYAWSYLGSPLLNGKGSEIDKFLRESKVHPLILLVKDDSLAETVNHLSDVFEQDVAAMTPGKLYVNDEYLQCYIVASSKDNFNKRGNYVEIELSVLAPQPVWVREVKMSFYPGHGDLSADSKAYANAYPYAYTGGGVVNVVENDSLHPSPAVITIYGYVENPSIKIGDHTYLISGTIQADERVVIDQFERTVVKVFNNGQTENWFGRRGKAENIFTPIEPGDQSLIMSGSFGVDVNLYIERSEPRWK